MGENRPIETQKLHFYKIFISLAECARIRQASIFRLSPFTSLEISKFAVCRLLRCCARRILRIAGHFWRGSEVYHILIPCNRSRGRICCCSTGLKSGSEQQDQKSHGDAPQNEGVRADRVQSSEVHHFPQPSCRKLQRRP